MKAKSEVTKELEKFILTMKEKDIIIQKIRCDNAGEHMSYAGDRPALITRKTGCLVCWGWLFWIEPSLAIVT